MFVARTHIHTHKGECLSSVDVRGRGAIARSEQMCEGRLTAVCLRGVLPMNDLPFVVNTNDVMRCARAKIVFDGIEGCVGRVAEREREGQNRSDVRSRCGDTITKNKYVQTNNANENRSLVPVVEKGTAERANRIAALLDTCWMPLADVATVYQVQNSIMIDF